MCSKPATWKGPTDVNVAPCTCMLIKKNPMMMMMMMFGRHLENVFLTSSERKAS